jgi:hypothetical protein
MELRMLHITCLILQHLSCAHPPQRTAEQRTPSITPPLEQLHCTIYSTSPKPRETVTTYYMHMASIHLLLLYGAKKEREKERDRESERGHTTSYASAAAAPGAGGLAAMRAIFRSSSAGRSMVDARVRFRLTDPLAYSMDWKNPPPPPPPAFTVAVGVPTNNKLHMTGTLNKRIPTQETNIHHTISNHDISHHII